MIFTKYFWVLALQTNGKITLPGSLVGELGHMNILANEWQSKVMCVTLMLEHSNTDFRLSRAIFELSPL